MIIIKAKKRRVLAFFFVFCFCSTQGQNAATRIKKRFLNQSFEA